LIEVAPQRLMSLWAAACSPVLNSAERLTFV
jgi:hypothetical protein